MSIVGCKKAMDDVKSYVKGEFAGARNAPKKRRTMEYKHVKGRVFSTYTCTPPVVKTDLAHAYGIEAPLDVLFEQGSNARLRIVLTHLSKRMRYKAIVHRVTIDKSSGAYAIAYSQLSLPYDEFELLLNNCDEQDDMKMSSVKR